MHTRCNRAHESNQARATRQSSTVMALLDTTFMPESTSTVAELQLQRPGDCATQLASFASTFVPRRHPFAQASLKTLEEMPWPRLLMKSVSSYHWAMPPLIAV